jgi:fluoroquinolone transport system ATP-binding protein
MIEVKDLHFNYPGNDNDTIRGLDFKVEDGEIFGFLGPSGAGKSTTQKIIIGILKNYRGSVKVMDLEIKGINSDFYNHVGVAFEFPNLYTKLTAQENLDLFRSLYSCDTEDPAVLLEMVGLEEDSSTRVSSFSKGMKMRLNFARAFLNKPDIVFLDEPTSGLDPVNARKVKDIILDCKARGKTVFLTTHNMTVAAEVCDRVAFIVDGKIALIDSPHDLMVKNGRRTLRIEYSNGTGRQTSDFNLEGIGSNPEFLSLIQEKTIETMHTLEASLEDIFIKTTGRRLS